MMNFQYHMGEDRGATLVEAAIVLPIFFLLVFGVLEFGFGFKDWLSINHAAREGARVAVAAADDVRADQQALEALVEGLVGDMLPAVNEVRIANPDDPTEVNTYTYVAGDPCVWSPCPNIDLNPSFEGDVPWPPSAREVTLPNVDRLELSIEFTHDYLTGLIGDDVKWTATKVMRIEPQG